MGSIFSGRKDEVGLKIEFENCFCDFREV
jgi:hypothetical protein